jgi:nicotinamide mononucleotide adenylyltransferase
VKNNIIKVALVLVAMFVVGCGSSSSNDTKPFTPQERLDAVKQVVPERNEDNMVLSNHDFMSGGGRN